MSLRISSNFDSGAIEIISAERADDIQLNIRRDSHADFAQWFHFRLQGVRDQKVALRFMNAGRSTYPDGWPDYHIVASRDRQQWFRLPSTYENGILRVEHTADSDSLWYAYFEPYSFERHLDLLGRISTSPRASLQTLGQTVDGRDLDMLVIGKPSAAKKIWAIARQHPGESMAEWFVEGMLEALIDESNPLAARLLQDAVLYVVPNMNPDGALRGNLRTNAAGANLNREWMAPSMERSPEVFLVRQQIHAIGCDLFLDVHGDEALPYVFIAGSEMLEGFSPEQAAAQSTFLESFKAASPDFQTRHGYGSGKYRAEMLTLASKYIGHTFKCVSLTLEMPFKDNAQLPDAGVGWNGERSKRLGAAVLQPMLASMG
jgi:murein tripeptide amidase MpaA